MAEYRLDELAQISGVSARNIRAYRERGLLDPPRRVGRSAFYDDYHLSQLRTINQLHRRGFSSAHIAEFFASLRRGADLADILGIQRAVLGPRTEAGEGAPMVADTAPRALDIDPDSDEALRLVNAGLAQLSDGVMTLTDPAVAQVVARATEQRDYVRALLHISEATGRAIDGLAEGFLQGLDECVAARFGEGRTPRPEDAEELGQLVRDYRDLWTSVVSHRLDKALHEHTAAADSGYAAGVLLSGRRES
ncbi:MerR family transcriptional regulator [Mycobacterium sp. GA-1999]|nr:MULTISPECIES: MerR family transcriptional regulator [unclassified Mycobacterium]KUH80356.1 MerR family transcriptional regulator [Mycobacterium sp. GA-0227b]KUH81911.1 MerR family transcriptional regulator [Mycobacterium sp. GA-1999]KUH94078.1 MerR family transcriptional regulator [Mycobacterium sp. IS-1556]